MVGDGTTARSRGSFAALAEHDFALLWWGQSISSLGDGIFTVALALETLRVDDHAGALGLVLAARTVPTMLLLLLGGVVVDRVPRRSAMLLSDLVRGAVVGIVAVLIASGTAGMGELIVLSLVFGTADAFFSPASSAIIPELLPPELLVQGNSLSTASGQVTQNLIGPAVGGLIVGLIGTVWSFGLDALSFAASVGFLLTMRVRRQPERSGASIVADARAGFRFIRERRWLLLSIVAGGFANLFGLAPFGILLPLLVRQVFHSSALTLGLALGAGGAGGLVASLIAARLASPKQRITVMWSAYGVAGVGMILTALAPDVWVVGAGAAAAFGFIVYGDVLYVSMMQAAIPPDMQGRTFSVLQLIAFGATPAGTVVAGFVAGAIGVRETLIGASTIGMLSVTVIFLPGARDPDLGDAARYPV